MNLTPSNILTAIKSILGAALVPFIKSSPGLGKSDIIRQLAKGHKLKVIDFRLAQSDPTDLNGYPTLTQDRKRSSFVPPETFPLVGDEIPEGYNGWLLFFDEINVATPAMQAAAYKIILDRMIGQQYLHKNVYMICAGNLASDRAVVNKLSTAMQSRLIHLTLEVSLDDWITWAIKNEIDHRVIAFLRFRPELLHKFDPRSTDDTFPCPRTWEFTSKLCKKWPTILTEHLPILIGTIGKGTAFEFKGFLDVYKSLPSITQITTSPSLTIVPTEPSTLFAITSLIGSNINSTNAQSLMEYIGRLPIEFQVITLQSIIQINPDFSKNPNIKVWLAANASDLI